MPSLNGPRLAIILLSVSGAMGTLSSRLMAQTTDTQCALTVPSSQACRYADSGSVAVLSCSEGESQSGVTASAGPNQNDWVHAWMRKVDEARASQPL